MDSPNRCFCYSFCWFADLVSFCLFYFNLRKSSKLLHFVGWNEVELGISSRQLQWRRMKSQTLPLWDYFLPFVFSHTRDTLNHAFGLICKVTMLLWDFNMSETASILMLLVQPLLLVLSTGRREGKDSHTIYSFWTRQQLKTRTLSRVTTDT